MKSSVAVALLLSLTMPCVAGAGSRGPSTSEERAKAVQLVHLLEAQPLHKDAKSARTWLLAWLAEVPDITVSMCPALLGLHVEKREKYAAELALQQALSSAAFIIEKPDQASNPAAVDLAGVEGVLRAYEALLAAKPTARIPSLDALLKARADGTLAGVVAENAKGCG
ncbi:MAG: hypothetical protein U0X73_05755 [Thermoanaerobaculia bacterium]